MREMILAGEMGGEISVDRRPSTMERPVWPVAPRIAMVGAAIVWDRESRFVPTVMLMECAWVYYDRFWSISTIVLVCPTYRRKEDAWGPAPLLCTRSGRLLLRHPDGLSRDPKESLRTRVLHAMLLALVD